MNYTKISFGYLKKGDDRIFNNYKRKTTFKESEN